MISQGKLTSCTSVCRLQVPPSTDSSELPVDHSKRDYADIDFAAVQKLEKSILIEDSSTTSNVMLPLKGIKGGAASKNMGSSEDKSGYVTVCDDCI